MILVLEVAAVICLLYYIVIILYSGITTSFAFVWVIAAVVLGILSIYVRFYKKNPEKVPLWFLVSGTTVCAAAVVIFIAVEILVFSGIASSGPGNLDYVIVLGAKVQGENISSSLRYRLNKAIEYLDNNPGTILVLSGGQGIDENKTEARAMYDYLLFNDVSPAQMMLEEKSSSTVENIVFSKKLINDVKAEKKADSVMPSPISADVVRVPDRPVTIGILTSNFHAFRAKAIAEKWGYENVYTIAAKSDPVLFVHLCVRECIAILKDKLVGNM